jgi:putative transposase
MWKQSRRLKEQRLSNPFIAETNFSSCQATLRRLDKGFAAFFRRTKAGEKPGYPRFKGQRQFDSVTFPSYGDGCKLSERHVYFQHIGQVKVKLHRPVVGKIKTVSFKREAGRWFVVFACETPETIPMLSTDPPVGIDLGLKSFIACSDGVIIDPPTLSRKSEKKLRVSQRRLSRRKLGSKRRAKARLLVARIHWHVANQRRDFHFKTAHSLVQRHGLIAHEDLNILGIARTRLAKSTLDAGWGQFLEILRYKAECAGVGVIAVNPRNTTQTCSGCGNVPEQKLTLADRQ